MDTSVNCTYHTPRVFIIVCLRQIRSFSVAVLNDLIDAQGMYLIQGVQALAFKRERRLSSRNCITN